MFVVILCYLFYINDKYDIIISIGRINMKDYFKYRFSNDIEFNLNEKDFVTIMGNNNDLIVYTLLNGHKKCNIFVGETELNKNNKYEIYRKMSIVLNKNLNIFSAETVMDEIAFGLESLALKKDDIINLITSESRRFKLLELLDKDPSSLGCSDKVKMKILSSLIIKPNILIIDNIISELDYPDKELIFDILKEYAKSGNIVINFTSDIEEALYADKMIIINDRKVVCEGKTLSVLNEEKLLKRLNIGLPFMIELSKYLMDYSIINKYYMTNEKMVGAIWK